MNTSPTRKPQTHRRLAETEIEPIDLPDGAQTDGTPDRNAAGEFKDTPAKPAAAPSRVKV